MPRSLEHERQAIEADERRLEERRRRLAEAECEEVVRLLDKSGLLKLPTARAAKLLDLMRKLGPDETERRLSG
jgi:hypothetical protein